MEFVPLPRLGDGEPDAGADAGDEGGAAPSAEAVIDLRDAAGPLEPGPVPQPGSAVTGPVGGRDEAAGDGTGDGAGADAVGPRGPDEPAAPLVPVSRRAVRWAALPVVAVLVGVLASLALQLLSVRAADRARDLRAAAEEAGTVRQLGDELHAGLLRLAVGPSDGAGPGADGAAGLEGLAARLSRQSSPDVAGPVVRPADVTRALREQDRLVATAGLALEGGPAELAGRLPVLDRRHEAFVEAWTDLAGGLRARALGEERRADRLWWAAELVLVPAFLAAAALLVLMARRLASQLDAPVAAMRRAVAGWVAGDPAARTGLSGPSDVLTLGRELDVAGERAEGRLRRLRQQAEWGAQSRMIFEALDLVETEGEAHQVAERALQLIDPEVPVEFLLGPHGSRELLRVAHNRSQPPPCCPVATTDGCPAIRRGQTAVWESSETINACPRLRDRPGGPRSGVCVPVTVAGRPVGVLHATGPDRDPPGERLREQLGTLSTQVGNRLGALRALESSRQDAATDKLTALPNRRLLEAELGTLIEGGTPFVLVLADLDRFKHLNDTFGHEVGDRALQLFAQVLRDKVRGNDVVARYGGEEFVLVYPRMSLTTSIEAIERIRDALAQTLETSRIPEFTCSFGITHSSVGHSAEAILRVADAGLLRAKELGGDQVVFADETLAARIFGDDAGVG